MFSGLIEEVGRVMGATHSETGRRLQIGARTVLNDTSIGDSIAISGACHTVVDLDDASFWVESVSETLARTTLGSLGVGDRVNLERSIRLQDRLGGHLIAGHVDGVGTVRRLDLRGGEAELEIEAPPNLQRYVASKGSVAIDGIALTVVDVKGNLFTIAIIPHT